MANNGKIIIKDEKELYKILPNEFRDEYSIGMHGFQGTDKYWKQGENGRYQLNESAIQQAKEGILSQGLSFQKGRTLLSTTRFNNLYSYVSTKGCWEAGGVIIALPKVLRSESGKAMFIGGPNEGRITEEQNWDRNHQATSLSEIILPEEGLLEPMFIIGTFTKNDYEIEVTLNPNHIAFNKGVVSNDYFKQKQAKLIQMMMSGKIAMSIIIETNRQKRNKTVSLAKLGKKSYQHFGTRIAEKLKETVITLRNKYLAKDKQQVKEEELSRK